MTYVPYVERALALGERYVKVQERRADVAEANANLDATGEGLLRPGEYGPTPTDQNSVPLRHARILKGVRVVANGREIWPARLDRRIMAGTIVHDGDRSMAWVVEVDHDDTEGFSTLRVQPLAKPRR